MYFKRVSDFRTPPRAVLAVLGPPLGVVQALAPGAAGHGALPAVAFVRVEDELDVDDVVEPASGFGGDACVFCQSGSLRRPRCSIAFPPAAGPEGVVSEAL